MALGALTLSVTQGVQGRPFSAVINGLTTGKVDVLVDGSPGFSTVNGRVAHASLPYPVSTVVLREYEPGVGQGYRDSRIDITAATRFALQQQAALLAGSALASFRPVGTRQPDGSLVWTLGVTTTLGETTSNPLPGGTPTPTLTLTGPLSFTAGAASGTLVANIGNVPAGATPALTPNDGRLVIAGDQASGWKVVVGLTASTAGTIALSVSAPGANGASASVTVSAAATIRQQASRVLAPGHGGSTRTASTGAAVQKSRTYVNLSGAPMSVVTLVFIGWYIVNAPSGTLDVGNDVPVTGTIETTTGTLLGNFSGTITNGGILSASATLTSAVAANDSYVVRVSTTLAAGLYYLSGADDMLGLAGIVSETTGVARAKVSGFGIGDSIATNNGSLWYTAALAAGCPMVQQSISGNRASYTAASFPTKQAPLIAALGITKLFSNLGSNDVSASIALATIQSNLAGIKAQVPEMHQSTITPKSGGAITVTASALSADGAGAATITVPDASLFTVGFGYTIAGANQSIFNGNKIARSVDTSANTVTFDVPTSATGAATGTITIRPTTVTGDPKLTATLGAQNALWWGPTSLRAQLNDWIRNSGTFAGVIELADAAEKVRNGGLWKTAVESSLLALPQEATITTAPAFSNVNRFICTYSRGSGTAVNAVVMCTSGGNRGLTVVGPNNSGGDFGVAPPSGGVPWAVGDTISVAPTNFGQASDDDLHPRATLNGFGGQGLIQNPANAYITALAA